MMKGKTSLIKDIAALIAPAIRDSSSLENAVKSNVKWTVSQLKKTPLLQQLVSEKKAQLHRHQLSSGYWKDRNFRVKT
jgi:hypothetical protein